MFMDSEMLNVLIPRLLRMRELQKATTPGAPMAHRVAVREAESIVDSLLAFWTQADPEQIVNAVEGSVSDE